MRDFPTPVEIGNAAVREHVIIPEALQPLVASMIAAAITLDRRLINEFVQQLYVEEGVLTNQHRQAIEQVLNSRQ